MDGICLGAAEFLRIVALNVFTDEFRIDSHVLAPSKTVQTKAISTHLRADDLFDPTGVHLRHEGNHAVARAIHSQLLEIAGRGGSK